MALFSRAVHRSFETVKAPLPCSAWRRYHVRHPSQRSSYVRRIAHSLFLAARRSPMFLPSPLAGREAAG